MQILIKKIIGNAVAYDVSNADRVEDVKAQIQIKEGIPLTQQDLIFAGRRLINGSMIQDYKINKNDTLNLIIRMR